MQLRYLEELEKRASLLGCSKEASKTKGVQAQRVLPASSSTTVRTGGIHGACAEIPSKGGSAQGWGMPPGQRLHSDEHRGELENKSSGSELHCAEVEAKQISTLMLGNLPYRASKKNITDAVDQMGFQDAYELCYVPNAARRGPRASNLGYAFIQFKSPEIAAAFARCFGDFRFPGARASK
eukprot:CAMPEP_0170641312 /NCGR_PEP_ID=MMETSP0224-20130122/40692_1 /TAXON_ID=285029 /ORGANISM="Togula jolla, Strain CCCM 725" /LENGTH=180 /DNA_ID=CAMNT_0010971879 /DNA_START=117 /DNA_END=656 /DNA_ORIENTATION=-